MLIILPIVLVVVSVVVDVMVDCCTLDSYAVHVQVRQFMCIEEPLSMWRVCARFKVVFGVGFDFKKFVHVFHCFFEKNNLQKSPKA